ncbi:acetyltransferase [Halomonas sp. PAMB 3232]|uniref:acetyltransferase n=1 Tax=Halomonas sp. PAMB 3232 TaxID=3075221 RepID=UPI00289EA2B5|nr:acetyltransferase [Halomonas sp. PAMB 3232]WNL38491.1 acetyltransferase [Halomonas sp. PAMB 3232]
MNAPPVILLGAGGHAKVVLDLLRFTGRTVIGVCDPILEHKPGGLWRGIPVLGGDNDLLSHVADTVELANGVGSLPGQSTRHNLHERIIALGYRFATLVHPSAVLSESAILGRGAQVMAGCVVQADVQIGEGTLVNTAAHIDHDCQLGRHVHIAPGAVLSGGIRIADNVHVGPNVTIIQGVTIGTGAIIGAGTTVLHDLPEYHQLIGQAPRSPTPL